MKIMKGTVILAAVFLLLPLAAFRACASVDYFGNRCLSFNGTNTYVTFGQSSNPMFESAQVTVEAWVKPTYNIQGGSDSNYGHKNGTVVARSEFYGILYGGWTFEFSYFDGSLQFGFTNSSYGSTTDYIDSNQVVWSASSWYYIAVTYDPTLPSGNLKLWVNGTLDSQKDDHNSIYYDSRSLQVAEMGDDAYSLFNGLIDEVRIWNVSRTAADIQNSWNRTLSNTEIANPSLLGYWRFDDGSGLYAQDSSSYHHTGTLMNGPQWINVGAPIVNDQTPPVIESVYQQPTNVTGVNPNDNVNVYANITDDLTGVEEAVLNYTTGNGTWNPVQMVNIEGSLYNAIIPAFPYGTNVTYVIMAKDGAGNTITTQEMYLVYQYTVTPELSSTLLMLVLMATTSISAILLDRRLRKLNRLGQSEQPELQ